MSGRRNISTLLNVLEWQGDEHKGALLACLIGPSCTPVVKNLLDLFDIYWSPMSIQMLVKLSLTYLIFSMESVEQVGRRERFLQSTFESLSGGIPPLSCLT